MGFGQAKTVCRIELFVGLAGFPGFDVAGGEELRQGSSCDAAGGLVVLQRHLAKDVLVEAGFDGAEGFFAFLGLPVLE